MKLRIHGDSVRLRLRRPQVQQLIRDGFVEQSTAFAAGAVLRYRLQIGGEAIACTYESAGLVISVPVTLARRWAESDQVGLTYDQPAGDGRVLKILIEKDFACKDAGNGESKDGAYENPLDSVC